MSNKIIIATSVPVNTQKAWDYYNEPVHITQWNFADPSWHCPSASNNMVPGGKYSARMEARDGSFGFDFEATYNEVIPGKSFTYTMPDGREVNVLFEANGDGQTNINVSFDPETENPLEMQKAGWQAILDNYQQYVANN
ncbi:SRPBCC family protein [Chitinophaga sp. Cy-1792]|uniref:SRPBCC family protein n=1 Tax=Chitinophaga sp. Cy-1792 TaxID=2608339 RepID=UPI001420E015|nr:SRPBCC family protein [Chitinophaga sp. Cy-1792]NIG55698.1 activator of HSP90 ATPase [Chitinophaga sp. Cy-1792]